MTTTDVTELLAGARETVTLEDAAAHPERALAAARLYRLAYGIPESNAAEDSR